MAGRPRKPKVIKLTQGTYRPDREVAHEPEPTVSPLVRPAPAHVGPFGKKLWEGLAEELVTSGVMTEVDWQALEICCESYNLYREAREAVYSVTFRVCTDCGAAFPQILQACPECKGKKSKLKKVKRKLADYLAVKNSQTGFELTTMHKAKEQFLKYAIQLGLTPVARNRIDVSTKPKEGKSDMESMWEESHG